MKLKKLTKKEFKTFADKNPEITFHQTEEWANLKKVNNWDAHYIGLEDDNKKIIAGALLLSKTLPIIKKKMFYSPRGFLIDYNDKDLLKKFTEEIKKYAKKEKAIFIKIDPFVEYQEHDNNGDIVKNGYNNKDAVENLKSLGYKFFGFNLMQDTLQPRWMHVIETKNRTLDDVMKDMESKTRQILRKNEKCGITTREITRDELPIFKDIMKHTSDRREFVDRPLSYYEAMWDALHDSGILKILIAEIDFNKYEKNTLEEKEEIEKNKLSLKATMKENILHVEVQNGELFGPQPYLAIKTKCGEYFHDNFDFQETGKSFSYVFDAYTIPVDQLECVKVAGNDKYGNQCIVDVELK